MAINLCILRSRQLVVSCSALLFDSYSVHIKSKFYIYIYIYSITNTYDIDFTDNININWLLRFVFMVNYIDKS